MGCQNWSWIKLSHDCAQWRALTLAVLKFVFYYQKFSDMITEFEKKHFLRSANGLESGMQ